jgi:hypothetical protein
MKNELHEWNVGNVFPHHPSLSLIFSHSKVKGEKNEHFSHHAEQILSNLAEGRKKMKN